MVEQTNGRENPTAHQKRNWFGGHVQHGDLSFLCMHVWVLLSCFAKHRRDMRIVFQLLTLFWLRFTCEAPSIIGVRSYGHHPSTMPPIHGFHTSILTSTYIYQAILFIHS